MSEQIVLGIRQEKDGKAPPESRDRVSDNTEV